MSGESDLLFSSTDSLFFPDLGHGVEILSAADFEKEMFGHVQNSSYGSVTASDLGLSSIVNDEDVFRPLSSPDMDDPGTFSPVEDKKSSNGSHPLGVDSLTNLGLSGFGGGEFVNGDFSDEDIKKPLSSEALHMQYQEAAFQDIYGMPGSLGVTPGVMVSTGASGMSVVDCTSMEQRMRLQMQMQMGNAAASTSERLNSLSLEQMAQQSGAFGQNLGQPQGQGIMPCAGQVGQARAMGQGLGQGVGPAVVQGFTQAGQGVSQGMAMTMSRIGRQLPPLLPQTQLQRQGSMSAGASSPVGRRLIPSPMQQQAQCSLQSQSQSQLSGVPQYLPNGGCQELAGMSVPVSGMTVPMTSMSMALPALRASEPDCNGGLPTSSSDSGERGDQAIPGERIRFSAAQTKTIFMPSAGLVHRASVAAEAAGLVDAGGDGLRPLPSMPLMSRTMQRSQSSHALGQLRTLAPMPLTEARLPSGYGGIAPLDSSVIGNPQLAELQAMNIRPVIQAMGGMRRVHSAGDIQTLNGMATSLGHGLTGLERAGFDDGSFRIGRYTMEERKSRIHRYREKRNERNFNKKIKYACRKTLADSRPRVRGRFARNDEVGELQVKQEEDDEEDSDMLFEDDADGESELLPASPGELTDMVRSLHNRVKLEPSTSA